MTYARRELLHSRILIVEDNTDLRRVLTEILQYEGYITASAASAEEALAMLAELDEPPELVISDILLEGMDGCAFLIALRKNKDWRAMPVLFLSGQIQTQAVCGDTGLEPDAFVEKPFTIQELVTTIKVTIERGHVPPDSIAS